MAQIYRRISGAPNKREQVAEPYQVKCLLCPEPLLRGNHREAVKDHCHISGKYRGAAHWGCDKTLRLNVKTLKIPVVFHNLQGYDAHLIMQAMAKTDKKKELSWIAKNVEKYISFEYGGLKFIDSYAFIAAGLNILVKTTPAERLEKTARLAKGLGGPFELLVQKGVYPCEYVDDFEKFRETSLRPKESFYSTLVGQGIGEKEWAHGRAAWEAFGCQTLGDYHDVYMQKDVALLADVFENVRQICLEK